jgi:tetratricopeptide (TPR) repeat protein
VGAVLDRMFEGAGERAIRTGFEVLGRLSEEWAEAASWIAQVLAHDLPGRALAAFEAAKSIGRKTAHALLGKELAAALGREGTGELAAQLEAAGLPDETVSLREVALWTTLELLRRLPPEDIGEEEHVLAERVRLLLNLGGRQNAHRGAALAATQQAAAQCRKLTAKRPDSLPLLAASVHNLGVAYKDHGQFESAADAMREAVRYRRQLAMTAPEIFLFDLVRSLRNLASMLIDLESYKEAVEISEEAVRHCRTLKGHTDVLSPVLAGSLHNLSNARRKTELAEALAPAQEALEIRRQLATVNPDAFLPDLAASLNDLSAVHSDLAERESSLSNMLESLTHRAAALTAAQEAADIRRKLVVVHPDVFAPYLAGSLSNLSLRQADMGYVDQALGSAEEAVKMMWPFFLGAPEAFASQTVSTIESLLKRFQGPTQYPSPALLARFVAATFVSKRPVNVERLVPLYCGLMADIKRRIDELWKVYGDVAALSVERTDGYCSHLRDICELLALACLVVWGDGPGVRMVLTHETYNVKLIVRKFSELAPEFYPAPKEGEVKQSPSGQVEVVGVTAGFLTKQELLALHAACIKHLSRANSGHSNLCEVCGRASIQKWTSRLIKLLNKHWIAIFDVGTMIQVQMHDPDDSRLVRWDILRLVGKAGAVGGSGASSE